MYRDLRYDKERKALVTEAGVVVVECVSDTEDAFHLMNSHGALEQRLEQHQWIRQKADLEDGCEVGVGGLAVDLGLYKQE